MEYFLLYLSVITASLKAAGVAVSPVRVVFSSALGCCLSVVLPLLYLPSLASELVRIAAGELVCLISFRGGGKKCLRASGAFLLCMSALRGISELLSVCSVGNSFVVCLVSSGLSLAFGIIAVKCRAAAKREEYICDCTVIREGAEHRAFAYLDSGNSLKFNGIPVNIVTLAFAEKFLNCAEDFSAMEWTEVATVNGKSRIPLLRADGIRISEGGKSRDTGSTYLGISRNFFSDEYSIILNREYIIGEENESS